MELLIQLMFLLSSEIAPLLWFLRHTLYSVGKIFRPNNFGICQEPSWLDPGNDPTLGLRKMVQWCEQDIHPENRMWAKQELCFQGVLVLCRHTRIEGHVCLVVIGSWLLFFRTSVCT